MTQIHCVDSLEIFQDIANRTVNESTEEPKISVDEKSPEESTTSNGLDVLLNSDIQMQQRLNEKTPSSRQVKAEQSKIRLHEIEKINNGVRVGSKSKRALFPSNDTPTESTSSKKRLSFKLVDIYARLHGMQPTVAHNAEEDAINLMKCFLAVKEEFIELAEKSAKEFMAIKPLGQK